MQNSKLIGHKKQLNHLRKIMTTGKIPQTMLFSGIEGIGKKIVAYKFLSSLFCTEQKRPCGKCKACLQIKAGSFPDFILLSPNEKGRIPIGKNGDSTPGTVRWLIHRLTQQPITDKYAVIIDGIDRIGEEGQNALLKTIEEPGLNTYLVLLTSNRSKILPTILSRCSEVKFNPLSCREIEVITTDEAEPDSRQLFINEVCGGSAKNALELQKEETLETVLEFASKLAAHFQVQHPCDFELSALQKKCPEINIVDISINIFSEMLRITLLKKSDYNSFYDKLSIDEPGTIRKIIKILLAIKKTELNNVSPDNALKGMCSFDFASREEIPPLMERINL